MNLKSFLENKLQLILKQITNLSGAKKSFPAPLNVKNAWSEVDSTKHRLFDYISEALEKTDIPEGQRKKYVNGLRDGIGSFVKPKVMLVGRSDTGKSSLINALLGTDKIPAKWTPMTSIAVYIKHIADKPAFMKEDVWVFANPDDNEDLWNERCLDDEDYCQKWKIGAGSAEILRLYGTHNDENHGTSATAAVIFIDAPILNNCDIVDLPGFATPSKNDDNITLKVTQMADVIVYLSQANGFMQTVDISYLKDNLSALPILEKNGENNLPPLSNLFIVASQADIVSHGNREELNTILDVGCTSLLRSFPDGHWGKKQEASGYVYGKEEFRSRFFTYTTDIQDLCVAFNDELKKLLEALPAIISEKVKAFVAEYVRTQKPNLTNELKTCEEILSKRDEYITLLKEIDNDNLKRVRENDSQKKDMRAQIQGYSDDSIREFAVYSAWLINTDTITERLKSEKVERTEDDIKLFCSRLQSMLVKNSESILEDKSKLLSSEVSAYITRFSENISFAYKKSNVKVDFDAAFTFAEALGSSGFVGGLGGLGTFLVLRLGGSLLGKVAMGFSAFFGPIGIAVGVILTALSLLGLFGDFWQEDVAKKIVDAFDQNDINGKFRTAIRVFWTDTEKAFDYAAEKLDEEWETYVKNLRDKVNKDDVNEIQSNMASLKYILDSFDKIPL